MVKETKIGECSMCKKEKVELVVSKWCKDCKNKYERERRAKQSKKRKEEIKKTERARYEKNKKKDLDSMIANINLDKDRVCTVCNETKKTSEFHIAKQKGTVRTMCKKCSSKDRTKYYQNNKKAVNKQVTRYQVDKMKVDPLFKLERRLRTRIYQAFTAQDSKKSERTWKYINCSPKQFQEWIVYQLYDGMTLDNYGPYWHIDHVKQCSKFDLSDDKQVKECFSWKNLRPLRAEKNSIKSDKIILNDIVLQQLKVKCFEKVISKR
jgi:hypothetical protein